MWWTILLLLPLRLPVSVIECQACFCESALQPSTLQPSRMVVSTIRRPDQHVPASLFIGDETRQLWPVRTATAGCNSCDHCVGREAEYPFHCECGRYMCVCTYILMMFFLTLLYMFCIKLSPCLFFYRSDGTSFLSYFFNSGC